MVFLLKCIPVSLVLKVQITEETTILEHIKPIWKPLDSNIVELISIVPQHWSTCSANVFLYMSGSKHMLRSQGTPGLLRFSPEYLVIEHNIQLCTVGFNKDHDIAEWAIVVIMGLHRQCQVCWQWWCAFHIIGEVCGIFLSGTEKFALQLTN